MRSSMHPAIRHLRPLLAAALLCAGSSAALAKQRESASDALARGKAALKAGKVHEACEALAASEQAEAAAETELTLADCYQQDGKPVAAARMLRAAAERESSDGRRDKLTAKADKLEAHAPRLRFAIDHRVEGLVIKVDGLVVSNKGDVRVDLGPHDVVATAPGYEAHASAPIDREGAVLDVILRMQPVAETTTELKQPESKAAVKPKLEPTDESASDNGAGAAKTEHTGTAEAHDEGEASSRHGRSKTPGIAMVAGGGALLIGAAVMFELGTKKFDDEHALCPGHLCATDANTATANSLRSDGRTYRGVSIGMGIGGAVLGAVGAYWLVSSHGEAPAVALHTSAHGAMVTYGKSF